jgi:hypothetical protein
MAMMPPVQERIRARRRPRAIALIGMADLGPFLIVGVVSVAMGYLAGDWIAALGVWVLAAGWRFLQTREGPPVLALAFTFQWAQITAGVYHYALTGRRLDAMDLSDYRPMVLIGLGCLVAILLGLKLGLWLARPRTAGAPAAPQYTVSFRALLIAYLVDVAVSGPLQQLAWHVPGLTQGILALTFGRLGLLFLMFRRLCRPRVRLGWIGLLLTLEVGIGFTGYYAGFREPMMMAAVALLETFDRRRLKHWLVVGGLIVIMSGTGVLWLAVRGDYRHDLDSDAISDSREERLAHIGRLTRDWLQNDPGRFLENVDFFVDRLWAVYYPALAVSQVPAVLPHENGAILWRAVQHLAMPRFLFPDKPGLASDSDMVRKYAGVWVAGSDENTSIAFGYAVESYIDFGVPLMFLPVFVYALLLGAAYEGLLRAVRHRELAVALVTVIFWMSLYLFERSWVKHLGFTITLIVYLGGATIVADRVLLWLNAARPTRRPAPLGRGVS